MCLEHAGAPVVLTLLPPFEVLLTLLPTGVDGIEILGRSGLRLAGFAAGTVDVVDTPGPMRSRVVVGVGNI